MKHYILLSVKIPNELNSDASRKWQNLSQRLEPLGKSIKGIVQIGQGVWLIPRDTGMPFVSECMAGARATHLKSEARFLISDN